MVGERVLTLVIAQIVDRMVGEPPVALHPVVWIGSLATTMERRAVKIGSGPQLAYGAALLGAVVGAASVAAVLAESILGRLPWALRVLLRALLLKPTFAVRELLTAAERVQALLENGDLDAAREALRDLVSRDPAMLDSGLIASAAVESLAENASDSIVAPWLAFVVGGLPGAYAYRAVNTLDAMIGYRGRYEALGKPAARLDDLLNLVPARLTAALLVAVAGRDGDALSAARTALREHNATASPNAGWPMAAMAGALTVRLEKLDHYVLGGDFRPPVAMDIAAARRLVWRLAVVLGCGLGGLGLGGVLALRQKDRP